MTSNNEEIWKTTKDLLGGSIGGVTGIITGQPLDSIRVRLQNQGTGANTFNYKGPWDCFRSMVRQEGFLSLYKGLLPPVLANLPINAIVFGSYGATNRYLENYFPNTKHYFKPSSGEIRDCYKDYCNIMTNRGHLPMSVDKYKRSAQFHGEIENLSLARLFSAGLFAGLVQCVVSIPAENIKIKLQSSQGTGQYANSFDCFRKIYRADGIFGVYRGGVVNILRDAPAYGIYFAAYEWARHVLSNREWFIEDRDALLHSNDHQYRLKYTINEYQSIPALLAAGSFAGLTSWLATYPLDVLKSVIQSMPISTPTKERHLIHVAKNAYAKYGYKFFFRGLGTTMIRSIPVNAVTFFVYEKMRDYMGNFD